MGGRLRRGSSAGTTPPTPRRCRAGGPAGGGADGRARAARCGGRDHSSDLAVLRVEGLGGEAATPAGGEARVGQISLAVASPGRGEGPRAPFGIVSSVGGPVRTRRGPRAARRTRAHT